MESYSEDKKEENEEALHLQLDLVDDVWATAKQKLAQYQNLMARHYNSNVRHRDFQVGDLVSGWRLGATKGNGRDEKPFIRKARTELERTL